MLERITVYNLHDLHSRRWKWGEYGGARQAWGEGEEAEQASRPGQLLVLRWKRVVDLTRGHPAPTHPLRVQHIVWCL